MSSGDSRKEAAERLGVQFMVCELCLKTYVWKPDEVFSVMVNSTGGRASGMEPDDAGVDENGDNEVHFCCSHTCASSMVRTRTRCTRGIVWRSGKCGGTLMPLLEDL